MFWKDIDAVLVGWNRFYAFEASIDNREKEIYRLLDSRRRVFMIPMKQLNAKKLLTERHP